MLVLEEARVTYWATEMGLVVRGQREKHSGYPGQPRTGYLCILC